MPEIDEKLVENILSGNGEENGLKPISLDGSKGTTKESKIGANGDNNDEASGDGSTLLIKKLSEDAKLPQRGSRHAAGKGRPFMIFLLWHSRKMRPNIPGPNGLSFSIGVVS